METDKLKESRKLLSSIISDNLKDYNQEDIRILSDIIMRIDNLISKIEDPIGYEKIRKLTHRK